MLVARIAWTRVTSSWEYVTMLKSRFTLAEDTVSATLVSETLREVAMFVTKFCCASGPKSETSPAAVIVTSNSSTTGGVGGNCRGGDGGGDDMGGDIGGGGDGAGDTGGGGGTHSGHAPQLTN